MGGTTGITMMLAMIHAKRTALLICITGMGLPANFRAIQVLVGILVFLRAKK